MQAVLDANIVVSALLWGGTPFKLLELANDGKVVSPLSTPRAVPNDIDDDQIIACVLAAGAGLIASGDSDLLVLNPWKSIHILNAAEAVQFVKNAKTEQ